ncbi:hypothetical protein ABZ666_00075, partial [Streptomyces sp. NPDC007056]|uniref:hypothetical protein n=1 Tax=unclassified Streptomyces TaxID=2593676 RepID=UPI0033F9470D
RATGGRDAVRACPGPFRVLAGRADTGGRLEPAERRAAAGPRATGTAPSEEEHDRGTPRGSGHRRETGRDQAHPGRADGPKQ